MTQSNTPLRQLLPENWPAPKGYANGIVGSDTFALLGGQIGWDADGRFAEDFLGQVRQALANIRVLLEEAGGGPEHLARMTWFVTDMDAYRSSLKHLGGVYREEIGRNFPAMSLVQVVSLVEAEAMVEIEATAILPGA